MFENQRHALTFCICSVLNRVSVIVTGGSVRNGLSSAFSHVFLHTFPFDDILLPADSGPYSSANQITLIFKLKLEQTYENTI